MQQKYTKDQLIESIETSFSIAEVCRKLGLRICGGSYKTIHKKIVELKLDISHFTGKSWNKGQTSLTNLSIRTSAEKLRYSDEETFCENSIVEGKRLLKRLLEKSWKYECKECGISAWRNKPLTLHIDHINGKHTDNRLENLRLLCPNCHQQTETWGAKKRNGERDEIGSRAIL